MMHPVRRVDLDDRGAVRVTGDDARTLLQDLITCDLDRVDADGLRYGALLTPQGKILFAFFVVRLDNGYLLDCPADVAADLKKRLTLYRLRAKVEIEEAASPFAVAVIWGEGASSDGNPGCFKDPRHPALGLRLYGDLADDQTAQEAAVATKEDWEAHRIALGIAEFGTDYPSGEVFPHDVNLDQIAAVDFDKGCYVGQEVVSRMRHRGTARKRVLLVEGDEMLQPGSELKAGERSVSQIASASGTIGLAVGRLDRVAKAMNSGQAITAGGAPARVFLPPDVDYGWPEETDA